MELTGLLTQVGMKRFWSGEETRRGRDVLFRVKVVGSNPAGPTTTQTDSTQAKIFKTLWVLKDEYFYIAWLLRHEAFLRFGYDPDGVFSERTNEHLFRK